jgi:hypothetical protein
MIGCLVASHRTPITQQVFTMRHEGFVSIFDALRCAVRGLEAQPGPLPPHKQQLLQQLRAQITEIEAAQLVASPPSFVGSYEREAPRASRRYGLGL